MRRKLIAVVLALTMVATLAPGLAFAESKINKPQSYSDQATRAVQGKHFTKTNAAVISKTEVKDIRSANTQAASSYNIHIAGQNMQAEAYKLLGYANSARDASNPFQWDRNLENLAMQRAAELAVYYNASICPNGANGYTDYVAKGYQSATALYNANPDIWTDASTVSFAAAAFKSDEGMVYWAIVFSSSAPVNKTPVNRNYNTNVYVNVIDTYLDWESYLMNSTYKAQNVKSLQKGKTYYCWISNFNLGNNGAPVLLQTQDSRTSNTSVLTIDKSGKIKTKRAGVARISVSPSTYSQYEQRYYAVVRPEKVTGLKLTAKKRAMAISWRKISGASGYEIYRATSKNGSYKRIKTITKGTTYKYTNTKLKKGKKYYYKVRGYVKYSGKKYYGSFSSKAYKKAK